MSCDECPVGFYCPLLITASPQPCPSGFYANETKYTSCVECERGITCLFYLNWVLVSRFTRKENFFIKGTINNIIFKNTLATV